MLKLFFCLIFIFNISGNFLIFSANNSNCFNIIFFFDLLKNILGICNVILFKLLSDDNFISVILIIFNLLIILIIFLIFSNFLIFIFLILFIFNIISKYPSFSIKFIILEK